MSEYAAFLRAVNVGGTGKLPMAQLRQMCEQIGFAEVRTYIASGNVLFTSDRSRQSVKAALEDSLRTYADKPVRVVVRTAGELRELLEKNPFANRDPRRTLAILFDRRPAVTLLENAVGRTDEEMRPGHREVYVYYKSGIGRSKLRIPGAEEGTARNMNTIARMVELLLS